MLTKVFLSCMVMVLTAFDGGLYVNAIICYKCDSSTLDSCAVSLKETDLPLEECSSTECGIAIVNSITYRDCANKLPTSGVTYKKECSENLCNKGVFPPGRLKCHHCEGDNCGLKQIDKPIPCLQHSEEDECYTEIIKGDDQRSQQISRGCISNATPSPGSKLKLCNVNGCNNETAISNLKCSQCNSKYDRGCKMDLFTINSKDANISQYNTCEMLNVITDEEYCYTYQLRDLIIRGCSSDMTILSEYLENRITKCYTDLCNAESLPQQKCLSCNSKTDENCRFNSTDLRSTICGSPEVSSCYTCEWNNEHLTRGCGAPPISIQDSSNGFCYQCDDFDRESPCNSEVVTHCFNCNSFNNPNCVNWDDPEKIMVEQCLQPNSPCVTLTEVNGTTLRGCASEELNCEVGITNCKSCQGNYCNKDPFPFANRLRCYQCVGADDCENAIKYNATMCPQHPTEPENISEGCLIYNDSNVGVVRGCRSNSTQYYNCMLNSSSTCRICHKNGCNLI